MPINPRLIINSFDSLSEGFELPGLGEDERYIINYHFEEIRADRHEFIMKLRSGNRNDASLRLAFDTLEINTEEHLIAIPNTTQVRILISASKTQQDLPLSNSFL